jgi:molybdenum cofactor cytidylyltransferase
VVITVAGLSILGKLLTNEHVQRAEIFSALSKLNINQTITADAVIQMLANPQGGLKNIPAAARRVVLLNQADTPDLQSIGGGMARELLKHFNSVIVGTLSGRVFQAFEHTAGIILAAGKSTRYGAPKQLLDWKGKPFVQHIAETALQAGLWPVLVVTGSHAADVESALNGLPVHIVRNPEYQQGQSTSIVKGVLALPKHTGSAIFLLADQPQIPVEVIRTLVESHADKFHSIIAPLVLEERRANPVLFDQVTFSDLLQLKGDIGGRAIFSNYKVEYIPWHDDRLLFDVDKPEDYQRLVENETI